MQKGTRMQPLGRGYKQTKALKTKIPMVAAN
jgi:hypothetical protein